MASFIDAGLLTFVGFSFFLSFFLSFFFSFFLSFFLSFFFSLFMFTFLFWLKVKLVKHARKVDLLFLLLILSLNIFIYDAPLKILKTL